MGVETKKHQPTTLSLRVLKLLYNEGHIHIEFVRRYLERWKLRCCINCSATIKTNQLQKLHEEYPEEKRLCENCFQECPICFEAVNDMSDDDHPVVQCPNKHRVCKVCITEYIERSPDNNNPHGTKASCPQCRHPVEKQENGDI